MVAVVARPARTIGRNLLQRAFHLHFKDMRRSRARGTLSGDACQIAPALYTQNVDEVRLAFTSCLDARRYSVK
jgi:hypothetical protein